MTTRKDIQALRDEAEQSASLGNFEEAARLFDLALSAAGDGEIDDDRDLLIGLLLSSATAYGVARGSTESVGQLAGC